MKAKDCSSIQNDFSEIVKRAYERGLSDYGITVEKLIEDIKNDLMELKKAN